MHTTLFKFIFVKKKKKKNGKHYHFPSTSLLCATLCCKISTKCIQFCVSKVIIWKFKGYDYFFKTLKVGMLSVFCLGQVKSVLLILLSVSNTVCFLFQALVGEKACYQSISSYAGQIVCLGTKVLFVNVFPIFVNDGYSNWELSLKCH